MNAPLARTEHFALSTLSEDELIATLRESLYPGAKTGSIKLVLNYCKAAHLDPMEKPVHIVPMNVKDAQTGKWDWRDIVMPGINLYRSKAAKTGRLAGISEPEFGPMVEALFHDKDGREVRTRYPEWARVVVKRVLDNGMVAEFSAKEFWEENYATAGKDATAPNAMWAKRTRGQIGKCAEAQALRRAFSELGNAPTAEEMEGKTLSTEDLERTGAQTTSVAVEANVVEEWIKKAQATTKDADALAVYQQGTVALGKDMAAAATFKSAVIAHRTALRNAQATDVQPKDKPAATPAATPAAQETRAADGDPLPWEDDPSTGAEVKITYAKLADMIVKSPDAIALEICRDWLPEIQADDQRAELAAKIEARMKELGQ